jgi:hypothetical protein
MSPKTRRAMAGILRAIGNVVLMPAGIAIGLSGGLFIATATIR